MIEVEMKFATPRHNETRTQIASLGAELRDIADEEDCYLDSSDGRLMKMDEALRVRQKGESNFITYKGPKLDGSTKTRAEIEVQLAHGESVYEDARALLSAIGYEERARIKKKRERHSAQSGEFTVEVSLDLVDDLGCYVELEILADPENLPKAREALLDLARKLQLVDSERRSYLEIWRDRRHGFADPEHPA